MRSPTPAEVAHSARPQLYRPIHKALRAEMMAVLTRVGQADPGDDAAVLSVLAQVDDLLTLTDAHLHKEDHFLHDALRARDPQAVQPFDDEHAEARDIARTLRNTIAAVRDAGPGRRAALYRLYLELSLWLAHQLTHMAEEETMFTQALWNAFSDDDMHEIERRIVASIPPHERPVLTDLLIKGQNLPERVEWMMPMRDTMPAAAFAQVLDRARALLPAREWQQLMQRLQLGADEMAAALG